MTCRCGSAITNAPDYLLAADVPFECHECSNKARRPVQPVKYEPPQTCIDPECLHEGVQQPENFKGLARMGRRDNRCKDCHARISRLANTKRHRILPPRQAATMPGLR